MDSKNNQHYYTSKPQSEYKEYDVSYSIEKHNFKFVSASGVFSRTSVDFGSDLLIQRVLQFSHINSLLDIGCGYGVIGISLSAILGIQVVMCDINERAIKLAKTNAKGQKVTVIRSDGFENINNKFDAIVTNPPIRAGKEVYYSWFKDSKAYLNSGGEFFCVIQKKQGAPSAKKYLEQVYGNCDIIAKDKGYNILHSIL